MARGQLVQVCVDVFGCCEMYKCSLVAFNTQARNKAKEEREREKKKKVSSNMSAIVLFWVDIGTCRTFNVFWHQVSLH